MDGPSNELGSGADLVLENPNKHVIEFILRFGFKASNNEADYKTVIPYSSCKSKEGG